MRSNVPPNAIPDTEAPAAGLGRARRVARRTTDLLAIAILAIAGLSVGDRLIEWWGTDADDVTPTLAAGHAGTWGADGEAVAFQFGEQPLALTKQQITGDASRAREALRTWCGERVTQAPVPAGEVTAAERKFLDRIAAAPVSTEAAGRGRIVWLDEPLPLAVGLASTDGNVGWDKAVFGRRPTMFDAQSGGPAPEAGLSHPTVDAPQHAAANPRAAPAERVICWGMVVPAGDDGWTLFGFEFQNRNGPAAGRHVALPLPPGSRRLLAFDDQRRGGLAAFDGTGPADDWIDFYRSKAEHDGWTLTQPWRERGSSHGARYRIPGNPPTEIDIQITSQPGNRLLGLLSIERSAGTVKRN